MAESRHGLWNSLHYLGSKRRDRKSTRLNSSHSQISYAVFCLKNTSVDAGAERQQGFLLWMRRNGFRVVQKELKTFYDGTRKANLDVEIAVDMLSLACRYDTAVLRSEEHTSELQSQSNLVCRLLLEKKNLK